MPQENQCSISIFPAVKRHKISKYLYSHFAEHLGRCIYEGIWVGENPHIPNDGGYRLDTLAALSESFLPALRWPGGCFADNYHWMDGIGPRDKRPRRHNLWWNQPEPNAFGTDEFMRFCEMVKSEPYVCLNVGSGTVEEASNWVEYCNSSQNTSIVAMRRENGHPEPYNVKFWGIGNENWGCGGQMHPEYYAYQYNRFTSYIRGIAGPEAKLIACGSYTNLTDWDLTFFETLKKNNTLGSVDYLALHSYLGNGKSDLGFSVEDYYYLLGSIETTFKALDRACGFARAFSTFGHRIGIILDEWGTWWKEATVADGLFQQNTMQDAIFTAVNFHMFHDLGDWLFMTNMAQTINVLQALILTKAEKFVLTPTYHVYEMFRHHRENSLAAVNLVSPTIQLSGDKQREAVSVSASISDDGKKLFVSMINLSLETAYPSILEIADRGAWKLTDMRRLESKDIHDHNTFEEPEKVKAANLEGLGESLPLSLSLPPASITTLLFEA